MIKNYIKFKEIQNQLKKKQIIFFIHLDFVEASQLNSFYSSCKEKNISVKAIKLNIAKKLILNSKIKKIFQGNTFILSSSKKNNLLDYFFIINKFSFCYGLLFLENNLLINYYFLEKNLFSLKNKKLLKTSENLPICLFNNIFNFFFFNLLKNTFNVIPKILLLIILYANIKSNSKKM